MYGFIRSAARGLRWLLANGARLASVAVSGDPWYERPPLAPEEDFEDEETRFRIQQTDWVTEEGWAQAEVRLPRVAQEAHEEVVSDFFWAMK